MAQTHLGIMITHKGEIKYSVICPFRRYLDGNQIKQLAPGIFNNNSELTEL